MTCCKECLLLNLQFKKKNTGQKYICELTGEKLEFVPQDTITNGHYEMPRLNPKVKLTLNGNFLMEIELLINYIN